MFGACALLGTAVAAQTNTSGFEIEAPSAAVAPETLFVTPEADTLNKSQLDSLGQELSPLTRLPELKEFIKADYPASELKAGREGTVVLQLLVSDSGHVDSATIVRGLSPDFDSAALSVVRRFSFTPALAGSLAVPVYVEYEYRFSIQEEVSKIEQYVNLQGVLKEAGTRTPIKEGMVAITFRDTTADTTLAVPFSAYLSKIGTFPGQHVEEGRLVTFTDSLGRFSFSSLPVGRIRITFPIAGYEPDSAIETIELAKQLAVEYRLRRLTYSEYEIVVYGKMEKEEVGKSTLTLTEVKRIPGFGGDAVKVIQALPGVSRSSFGMGGIVVRGSGSGDSRYFLDGVELPMLFHFGGLKSTYNSDALSSIDLYPGGFNTRYGGCIGGVVEIKGRPARTDRWHVVADANFIDASIMAEGPVTDDISVLFTARRSYIANMAAFALDLLGVTLPMTVVPYYYDAVLRLDWRLSKKSRMFLTGFTFKDAMKFIIQDVRGGSNEVSTAKDEISQETKNQMLIFGYDTDLSDKARNELRFSLATADLSFNILSFTAMDFSAHRTTVRDELSFKLNDKVTLRPALDLELTPADYTLRILGATGAVQSGINGLYSDLGVYVNCDIRPIKSLLLIPGLRYDHYLELEKGAPSVRFTARWDWRKGHTLKGAAGTYNQSPEPFGQATDPKWGNDELPPTHARHFVLGYEYQFTDLISLDVQGYYNTQDDIPMSTDSVNEKTGKPVNLAPIQKGRMYGMEFMLRHDQGDRFFGWIAYTLARSERQSPIPYNLNSFDRATWDKDLWYLYGSDQTHNLQIVGSWRLPHGFEAGMRVRYVTGNPLTPQLGYTEHKYQYNAEFGYYEDLQGTPRSERMGPFFQLDIRVDKKFVYRSWILSTYLDVQNTNYFFYNSPEFYQYNYDSSERQVIGGIIIPSLGIRAEF